MDDIKDKILKKVKEWGKNQNRYFSDEAEENCKHYLYTEKDITPEGYGKWMKDIWINSPWKKLLENYYKIKLCGIHYYSPAFKETVTLAPISVEDIERTLKAHSETLLRLSSYKYHFAYIMRKKRIKKPCHFRIGGKEDVCNKEDNHLICYISDKTFNFFVKNFEICHLPVSLENVIDNSSKQKSGLNKLKNCLKSMCLVKKNDNSGQYLKSIIISFYATLTVMKKSNEGEELVKPEELFNTNGSADAIFIPIDVPGGYAVIPSLHSKPITSEEINSLIDIYEEVFKNFILWEQYVKGMPKVKIKLESKFPSLSDALEKLERAAKELEGGDLTLHRLVSNSRDLLKKYINRGTV